MFMRGLLLPHFSFWGYGLWIKSTMTRGLVAFLVFKHRLSYPRLGLTGLLVHDYLLVEHLTINHIHCHTALRRGIHAVYCQYEEDQQFYGSESRNTKTNIAISSQTSQHGYRISAV